VAEVKVRSVPVLWWLLALAAVVTGVLVYLAFPHSDQARVSADTLPVAHGARRVSTYVDCSKIGAVAYNAQNPCETFVLVRDSRAVSTSQLLGIEDATLRNAGWRQGGVRIPADQNGVMGPSDRPSETWQAPNAKTCAYVTTVRRGVKAEHASLFPYVTQNQPAGVLRFDRTAQAARSTAALWVRLGPYSCGR
jgi:hypothetical protein